MVRSFPYLFLFLYGLWSWHTVGFISEHRLCFNVLPIQSLSKIWSPFATGPSGSIKRIWWCWCPILYIGTAQLTRPVNWWSCMIFSKNFCLLKVFSCWSYLISNNLKLNFINEWFILSNKSIHNSSALGWNRVPFAKHLLIIFSQKLFLLISSSLI